MTSKEFKTETKCRIERVVRKSPTGKVEASFVVHIPELEIEQMSGDVSRMPWMACQATTHWFANKKPTIFTTQRALNAEQAAAMQVAIGMAIDWIAEQV